jgi:hypothetical protein
MGPCATPQQFEGLVNDQLEESERATIAAHLEHCAACQQALERLTGETNRQAVPAPDGSPTEAQLESLGSLEDRGPLREAAGDAARTVDGGADDDLLELLVQWDEHYRRGEELPPGWPALTDPTRQDALQRGIERRKRLYALMDQTRGGPRPGPASRAYPAIAGFRILREIGRGGMGVVYEAEQEVLSRRVALKVLPAHALVHSRQVHRFEREAKAAARLHHTNIVPVFGFGQQDGHHYYVMQYIEGSGLDLVLGEMRRRHEAGPGPAVTARIVPSPGQPGPRGADRVEDPGHPRTASAELADSLASGRFGEPGPPPPDHDGVAPAPAPAPAPQPDPEAVPTAVLPPARLAAAMGPPEASAPALPGSAPLSSHSEFNRPYFRSEASALYQATLGRTEAKLGPDHPYTLECRSGLALVYDEHLGRRAAAERLFRDVLARRHKTVKPGSPLLAYDLAQLGRNLLEQGRGSEAEPPLRQCLAIREQATPDEWWRYDAMSLLGGSLLAQGRYAQAEPLVVVGYEKTKAREDRIAVPERRYLLQAAERVIRLYESWGRPDQATTWKAKLGVPDLPADVFARP